MTEMRVISARGMTELAVHAPGEVTMSSPTKTQSVSVSPSLGAAIPPDGDQPYLSSKCCEHLALLHLAALVAVAVVPPPLTVVDILAPTAKAWRRSRGFSLSDSSA